MGEGVRNSRKRRGKCFKVEHKGSSKLGITMLDQAGQVHCDNGLKNIPVNSKHIRLNIFNLKTTRHCIVFVNKEYNFSFQ